MNYLKLVQNLKKDLNKANSEFKSVKFFRKDIVSVWVWFSVLEQYYDNNNNNIENIIREIPNEYASRPKIFKIMMMLLLKIFLKKY